jgi:hypothetical protein
MNINKLNNPVYIISLNNKSKYDFSKIFNNVKIYNAIDARKYDVNKLLDEKIISWRVLNDIKNGRKDHFGFVGLGGIGLYLTHRKLFKELEKLNIDENILICEDDCNIKNEKEFIRKINLLNNYKNFDVAIFGGYKINTYMSNIDKQFINSNNILNNNDILNNIKINKDFENLKSDFILYHSSLWSPSGIKKMNMYLNDIIEFQIDGFLSKLAINNKLNILLEKTTTTNQFLHKSTLDNDNDCKICDMNPKSKKYFKNIHDIIKEYTLLTILVIFTIVYLVLIFTKN